jgi:hypothetical protein
MMMKALRTSIRLASIRLAPTRLAIAAAAPLLLSVAFLGAPAGAQSDTTQKQAPAPQQRPAPDPSIAVDDRQLESFAGAAREVQQISDKYAPQMQQAESAAAQEEIRRQASNEMAEAISRNGLSIEEYRQIYLLARADPKVADKVRSYLGQGG